MALMMLLGLESAFPLWIALFGAIGLAVWEVLEQKFERLNAMWWVLLVAMTHVFGYIALRIFVYSRNRGAES